MFNIILFEPEIPFNTGAMIRLCANTGSNLHLVEPIAFAMDDKKLRRAGLDYHEYASLSIHKSMDECMQAIGAGEVYACTTRGKTCYSDCSFKAGDSFLFGPETRGLPDALLAQTVAEKRIRIPMLKHSRSINLANSAAIIVYEAWRQHNFSGSVDISAE